MLEFALAELPLHKNLSSGAQCIIRPLEETDESAFREFYLAVPEPERCFVKHRVADPSLIHSWCSEIDFDTNLPLLAMLDQKIVANATLHQRHGGWKRSIGLVSGLIHPEFHGLGLMRHLVRELVGLARHAGLTKLEAEFNGDLASNIEAFREAGFIELTRIPKYVQDMSGAFHDYVLLGMNLIADEEYMGPGD